MNPELLQKLVVAKKIMDKQDSIQRGSVANGNKPVLESFEPINATYNIPQELLGEAPQPKPIPKSQNSKERILSSKLPDEIKKLMIEHPIEQPKTMGTETVLSDELVEAASRLMNTDASGKQIRQVTTQRKTEPQIITESPIDLSNLRGVLKEVVREVLAEQGVITESSHKTKEQITFRVGQHVFEGVITKIKKVK